MPNALLTVIVPVYQAQRYLAECLDSILRQTYRNLEVIAVDDGSTDGSAEILRTYAALDTRVRVCRHEKNLGLFRARITGVQAAKGMYIGFVDSDDVIASDYFRPMVTLAERSAAELVTATTVYQTEEGARYIYNRCDGFRLENVRADSPFNAFWGMAGANMELHTVWNKLYTRALLERCLPWLEKLKEHIVMAEDVVFSTVAFFNTKKTVHMPYSYYFYRQHAQAATGQHPAQRYTRDIEDITRVFAFLASFLQGCDAGADVMAQLIEWKKRFARIWRGKVQAAQLPAREKDRLARQILNGLQVTVGYEPEATDTFFYELRTAWDGRYYALAQRIAGDGVETVSFDVFDTLLVRPFLRPTDLFPFLQDLFCEITGSHTLDFAQVRMRCEGRCYKEKGAAVSLRDIYREIEREQALTQEGAQRLMREELGMERRFCRARESARNLAELADACGKRIVCVSDMYLSGEEIHALLDQAGYGMVGQIAVSCEYGCDKSGGLFQKIIRKWDVEPSKMLHIGDSKARDVEAAQKAGIQSAWYPSAVDCLLGKTDQAYTGRVLQPFLRPDGTMTNLQSALRFHGIRCMLGVAANRLYDCPFLSFAPESCWNSDPVTMGYLSLGPHLFALTQWIIKNSAGRPRAVFAARDGWLPMQAYLLARARCTQLPEAAYLPVSRKALLPCFLSCARDVYLLPEMVQIHLMTPQEVLVLLAPVLREDAASFCAQNGVRLRRRLTEQRDCDVFLRVLMACFDAPRAKDYQAKVGRYFAARCPENSVLFDIGYSGRSSQAIRLLTGHSFQTLYIHINADTPLHMEQAGMLSLACFYGQSPSMTGVGREALFSEQGPSCTGYTQNAQGYISPVFEQGNRGVLTDYAVNTVQVSALAFVRDMLACFGAFTDRLAYRRADASALWELLLHKPSRQDLELFALTPFEDMLFAGVADVPLSKAWEKELVERRAGAPEAGAALRGKTELEELYADGIWMALYRKGNRLFPKGSRRREFLKRMFSFLK